MDFGMTMVGRGSESQITRIKMDFTDFLWVLDRVRF